MTSGLEALDGCLQAHEHPEWSIETKPLSSFTGQLLRQEHLRLGGRAPTYFMRRTNPSGSVAKAAVLPTMGTA
jgi:hypothetical protein